MKRHHIPLKTKLAAALACLLPQADRDYYRRRNVPADEILRLFEWDHVSLHCFGGSDLWWNLDPKSKAAHREKSRRDTGIAAKVRRLSAREQVRAWIQERLSPEMQHRVAVMAMANEQLEAKALCAEMLEKKGKRKWPSRKIENRPFPKGKRRTTRT
jgi:hypothetical protein